MTAAIELRNLPARVDNTDWLKTFAIILVVIDHTGYFFIEDASWWNAFGRMAAPVFFFLLGYARSRTIPFHWLWLGAILTLLDSWNNDWEWVAPNILFSLALIRFVRPSVLIMLQRYGRVAFCIFILALMLMLPVAGNIVDYGAEGWLWALFGLCQRMYVESRSGAVAEGSLQKTGLSAQGKEQNWRMWRLISCLLIAVVYTWQEQVVFSFSEVQIAVVAGGVGILSAVLAVFARGPSKAQPPAPIAASLRFMGRRTLEIYAIQLAGSELLIHLIPELAA